MDGTIGGVSISSFGFKVLDVKNELSMPGFKQILAEHDFTPDMRILSEKDITVRLFGKFTNQLELGFNVQNLLSHIKSEVRLQWTFPTHSFDELCVIKKGISSKIHGRVAVELTITLTVTAL